MNLHGTLGQIKPAGYHLVRVSLAQRDDNLPLAWRQRLHELLALHSTPHFSLHGSIDDIGREPLSAAGNLSHAIGQAFGRDILEHDTFGATCYSSQDLSIGGSGAQKYNLRSKSIRGYARQDIEAIQTGHADIEHSDVRHEPPNGLCRGDPIPTERDDVDVRLRSKNTGHPVKHDGMIVGQNNGNRPPRLFMPMASVSGARSLVQNYAHPAIRQVQQHALAAKLDLRGVGRRFVVVLASGAGDTVSVVL